MGKLIRCISNDGLVMALAVDSTDIVKRAMEIQKTTPVMTTAFGRLLTGASIMGAMLKEKDASMTIRVNGGGEGGSIIAVSDSQGNVRGYAENPGLLIMPDENKKLDVKRAVGNQGLLSVIKDFGEGEPYIGQVPLVSGEIAEDLAYYYGISEQIPTVFSLGVSFDKMWNFHRAGGCFIQLLPAADSREIDKIENGIKNARSVTKMLEDGLSPVEMCRELLPDFKMEALDSFEVNYHCPCSVERVYRSISTLQPDEIETLAGDNGYAEVNCHFCDAQYHISQEELNKIADKLRKK